MSIRFFSFGNRKSQNEYPAGHVDGHQVRLALLLVEARGVEPLSENTSTQTSPGADGYCGTGPVPALTGKPSRL